MLYLSVNKNKKIMRILMGLIGIIFSFLLVIYREKIVHFTGHIQWAEQHLGAGGTYSVLVIAGIVGFFFSLMYMTNSFDLIFGGVGVDFFDSTQ